MAMSSMVNRYIAKRWHIINKNTGGMRGSRATRSAARAAKKSYERIFDSVTGKYVR